jgi:hypothetical protein
MDLLVAGTPESITTAGTLPVSQSVGLSTPGTYYWQAVYSGDSSNDGSTSSCGSEVETVTSTGTGADLVVTIQAPSTVTPGVGFPVSVTVTNDGPAPAYKIIGGLLVSKKLIVLNPGENSHMFGPLLWWYQPYVLAPGADVVWTVWLCSPLTSTGTTVIPAGAVSLVTPDPNYKNNFAADSLTFDPPLGPKVSITRDRRYRSAVLLSRLRAVGKTFAVRSSRAGRR